MPAQFNRTARINDVIQRELGKIINFEFNSSMYGMITIINVLVSPDLSFAKIFISILQEEKIAVTIQALNDKAVYLRHQLAQKIKLRAIPKLRFMHDDSLLKAHKISCLIDKAINLESKPLVEDEE
ncbi:MAG: ribosome-binding factor [Francisellaceae bacterium]|nr:ribosome-binding factor [Francisellaceae bacterium]